MFAFKTNATFEVGESVRVRRKGDMFLRVTVGEQCVFVIMQLLDCACPRSRERFENKLDFDPRMVGSGHGVMIPLSLGAIDTGRPVEVRRIVLGIRYFPVCALAAVLAF